MPRTRPLAAARLGGRPALINAELAAAHEKAAHGGPRYGLSIEEILPPLARTLDEVVACVGYCKTTFDGTWAPVPLARPDPRTPWREQDSDRAFMAPITDGFIVVRGCGPMQGWQVTAWSLSPNRPVKEHQLSPCRRFDNADAAQQWAAQVVMADGTLPAAYTWAGGFAPDTPWLPAGSASGMARACAHGPAGLVTICQDRSQDTSGFTVWRGKPWTRRAGQTLDAAGAPWVFESLHDARTYIHSQGWL